MRIYFLCLGVVLVGDSIVRGEGEGGGGGGLSFGRRFVRRLSIMDLDDYGSR
jgi:hypothetical protein